MKPEDIKLGKTYRGKTGKPRTVVSLTAPTNYGGQMDRDCITYAGSQPRQKHMTRKSFASWAVEEVTS